MKAEEMFKELGYDKYKGETWIRYTNEQTEDNIEFYIYEDYIDIYNTCYNNIDDTATLFLDELKAINKQIEELGWK